jgi:hypothetical protein
VANSNFNSQFNDNLIINAALHLGILNHLSKVVDLRVLSLKIPTALYRNQSQSDLNNPNRQVVVGDAYGYNYKYAARTVDAFTQFKFNYNKVDFM